MSPQQKILQRMQHGLWYDAAWLVEPLKLPTVARQDVNRLIRNYIKPLLKNGLIEAKYTTSKPLFKLIKPKIPRPKTDELANIYDVQMLDIADEYSAEFIASSQGAFNFKKLYKWIQ